MCDESITHTLSSYQSRETKSCYSSDNFCVIKLEFPNASIEDDFEIEF